MGESTSIRERTKLNVNSARRRVETIKRAVSRRVSKPAHATRALYGENADAFFLKISRQSGR